MRGKLIAIDGVDGSGKGLQTDMLISALLQRGLPARKLRFPVYESDSSALVRMYLSGGLGRQVGDVNGYAASVFFAADRYASFKSDWGGQFQDGVNMVCDRYVSSNAIHQSVKVPTQERDRILEWVDELEYEKLCLPRPDLTIFLDMPVEVAVGLMERRYSGDQSKKDIHESDERYLHECHAAAVYAAHKFGWHRIECVQNGRLRSPEEIHQSVLERVKDLYAEF